MSDEIEESFVRLVRCAQIAQSVEHFTRNEKVESSILSLGSNSTKGYVRIRGFESAQKSPVGHRLVTVEHPDSAHVADLRLDTATDRAIWDYAGTHGYVIASKDTDFRQLAFLYGPPPKVIWLRVGKIHRPHIGLA